MGMQPVTTVNVVERPTSLYVAKSETLVKDLFRANFWRRMRDLNPRDFRLRVFETRALGHYANPPSESYVLIGMFSSQAPDF